jgi:hypothetical protein
MPDVVDAGQLGGRPGRRTTVVRPALPAAIDIHAATGAPRICWMNQATTKA